MPYKGILFRKVQDYYNEMNSPKHISRPKWSVAPLSFPCSSSSELLRMSDETDDLMACNFFVLCFKKKYDRCVCFVYQ